MTYVDGARQNGGGRELREGQAPLHVREVSPERVVYRGNVFEVFELDVEERGRPKTFERVRRAPGTRVVVRDEQGNVLLTREWRHELRQEDLRLPGGKVFDTFVEYETHGAKTAESLAEAAAQAAIRELREEAGIAASSVNLLHRSVCGATVDWDLYYFVAGDWTPIAAGQALEPGEEISTLWMSRAEVVDACLRGAISEERSALVLLRMLLKEQRADHE